jgi:hypothetical protein
MFVRSGTGWNGIDPWGQRLHTANPNSPSVSNAATPPGASSPSTLKMVMPPIHAPSALPRAKAAMIRLDEGGT